jgi:predicted DNA-binding transcriptional regulator AlpA
MGGEPNMERSELPIILQAKHITQMMGWAKSTTYELSNDPKFPALQINGRKLVYREAFFEYLDSKQRGSGGQAVT